MNRIIELIILILLWYLALAWIQWDMKPQGWHVITRIFFVLGVILLGMVANYPGGGKKGAGKS